MSSKVTTIESDNILAQLTYLVTGGSSGKETFASTQSFKEASLQQKMEHVSIVCKSKGSDLLLMVQPNNINPDHCVFASTIGCDKVVAAWQNAPREVEQIIKNFYGNSVIKDNPVTWSAPSVHQLGPLTLDANQNFNDVASAGCLVGSVGSVFNSLRESGSTDTQGQSYVASLMQPIPIFQKNSLVSNISIPQVRALAAQGASVNNFISQQGSVAGGASTRFSFATFTQRQDGGSTEAYAPVYTKTTIFNDINPTDIPAGPTGWSDYRFVEVGDDHRDSYIRGEVKAYVNLNNLVPASEPPQDLPQAYAAFGQANVEEFLALQDYSTSSTAIIKRLQSERLVAQAQYDQGGIVSGSGTYSPRFFTDTFTSPNTDAAQVLKFVDLTDRQITAYQASKASYANQIANLEAQVLADTGESVTEWWTAGQLGRGGVYSQPGASLGAGFEAASDVYGFISVQPVWCRSGIDSSTGEITQYVKWNDEEEYNFPIVSGSEAFMAEFSPPDQTYTWRFIGTAMSTNGVKSGPASGNVSVAGFVKLDIDFQANTGVNDACSVWYLNEVTGNLAFNTQTTCACIPEPGNISLLRGSLQRGASPSESLAIQEMLYLHTFNGVNSVTGTTDTRFLHPQPSDFTRPGSEIPAIIAASKYRSGFFSDLARTVGGALGTVGKVLAPIVKPVIAPVLDAGISAIGNAADSFIPGTGAIAKGLAGNARSRFGLTGYGSAGYGKRLDSGGYGSGVSYASGKFSSSSYSAAASKDLERQNSVSVGEDTEPATREPAHCANPLDIISGTEVEVSELHSGAIPSAVSANCKSVTCDCSSLTVDFSDTMSDSGKAWLQSMAGLAEAISDSAEHVSATLHEQALEHVKSSVAKNSRNKDIRVVITTDQGSGKNFFVVNPKRNEHITMATKRYAQKALRSGASNVDLHIVDDGTSTALSSSHYVHDLQDFKCSGCGHNEVFTNDSTSPSPRDLYSEDSPLCTTCGSDEFVPVVLPSILSLSSTGAQDRVLRLQTEHAAHCPNPLGLLDADRSKTLLLASYRPAVVAQAASASSPEELHMMSGIPLKSAGRLMRAVRPVGVLHSSGLSPATASLDDLLRGDTVVPELEDIEEEPLGLPPGVPGTNLPPGFELRTPRGVTFSENPEITTRLDRAAEDWGYDPFAEPGNQFHPRYEQADLQGLHDIVRNSERGHIYSDEATGVYPFGSANTTALANAMIDKGFVWNGATAGLIVPMVDTSSEDRTVTHAAVLCLSAFPINGHSYYPKREVKPFQQTTSTGKSYAYVDSSFSPDASDDAKCSPEWCLVLDEYMNHLDLDKSRNFFFSIMIPGRTTIAGAIDGDSFQAAAALLLMGIGGPVWVTGALGSKANNDHGFIRKVGDLSAKLEGFDSLSAGNSTGGPDRVYLAMFLPEANLRDEMTLKSIDQSRLSVSIDSIMQTIGSVDAHQCLHTGYWAVNSLGQLANALMSCCVFMRPDGGIQQYLGPAAVDVLLAQPEAKVLFTAVDNAWNANLTREANKAAAGRIKAYLQGKAATSPITSETTELQKAKKSLTQILLRTQPTGKGAANAPKATLTREGGKIYPKLSRQESLKALSNDILQYIQTLDEEQISDLRKRYGFGVSAALIKKDKEGRNKLGQRVTDGRMLAIAIATGLIDGKIEEFVSSLDTPYVLGFPALIEYSEPVKAPQENKPKQSRTRDTGRIQLDLGDIDDASFPLSRAEKKVIRDRRRAQNIQQASSSAQVTKSQRKDLAQRRRSQTMGVAGDG